jgi:hypothetical protein
VPLWRRDINMLLLVYISFAIERQRVEGRDRDGGGRLNSEEGKQND